MKTIAKYLYLSGLILLLQIPCSYSYAQVDITVITPKPDSLVPSNNLFISVETDSNLHFVSASNVEFYLDDYLLNGITKVTGNKVRFVYPHKIRDGKHTIKIEAKFKEYKRLQHGTWVFYSGKKGNRYSTHDNKPPAKAEFKITGMVSIDDREEFITGIHGDSLRQEPAHTRTVNIDAVASYKNMEIPLKIFATTDNVPGIQSMNYFQVGFRNKWLDIAAGDLNPTFDQLILAGVRVQGVGVKLKSHLSSIQFYYGDMTNPVSGILQPYVPGTGVIPTNVIPVPGYTDSFKYVVPGVYKRTMIAARAELGSIRDDIKLGFTAFKAKDDTNSIQNGLLPKDNVAGGIDVTVKALHKKLVVKFGAAMSILTNDISGGTISLDTLKQSYHVDPPFDPMKFRNIIILNASTLPANISPAFNDMASFATLSYTTKIQTLTIEAKDIGPLYYSLGNPFLLNDYQGVTAGERFSLFKKKVNIGLGYQFYSNDLDSTTYAKVYTQGLNGNLMVNPGAKWPNFSFNYLSLSRNGTSYVPDIPNVADNLTTYVFNVNYSVKFREIKHTFRVIVNICNRNDQINPQNYYASRNVMLGIGETVSKQLSISADVGKTIMTGYENSNISGMLVYNASIDWQIKPGKYFTSFAVSNNQTLVTPFSDPTFRFSFIGRFGYRFYKGMGLNFECGYQPFIDQTYSSLSYNEVYGYLRYTCELGKLFGKLEPVKKNIQ